MYTTHNINNIEALLRRSTYSFIERVMDSSNMIINTLMNSCYIRFNIWEFWNFFMFVDLLLHRILIYVPSITLSTIFLIFTYIKITSFFSFYTIIIVTFFPISILVKDQFSAHLTFIASYYK